MKSFILFSALLSLVTATAVPRADEKVSYDGYKVFRIATKGDSAAVASKLGSLIEGQWSRGANYLDLAVAPKDLKKFQSFGFSSSVMHEDLGSSIAAENVTSYQRAPAGSSSIAAVPSITWYNSYHPYADHIQYLKDLQSSFPSNSEIFTAGSSYQGRALQGIHIWGSGGKGSKPAIVFHGTVHAREWITTMTVEYVTYSLLTGYAGDATIRSLVDKYDFWILPIVNPDGFVYTQTSTRLWRKNRQPGPSSSSCVGRDINRNWPYMWNANSQGASTNPCDETYKGQAQGDAPENKGLVALTQQLKASKGIKAYIDWHSYGQYILSPYGYNCNTFAANNAQHQSIAQGTAKVIAQRYGTQYTTGPSCSTLYATTGSSVDYVYAVGGSQYAWTIELRDTGDYGFVLPANQIKPTADESFDGIKYLLANI